jgi:hypothetical protein
MQNIVESFKGRGSSIRFYIQLESMLKFYPNEFFEKIDKYDLIITHGGDRRYS